MLLYVDNESVEKLKLYQSLLNISGVKQVCVNPHSDVSIFRHVYENDRNSGSLGVTILFLCDMKMLSTSPV